MQSPTARAARWAEPSFGGAAPQDADGKQTAVEFIEAPEAAPVGERIGLEGLEMVDPITPAQVKKQKVWEEMVTKVCVPLLPPFPPSPRQIAEVCV